MGRKRKGEDKKVRVPSLNLPVWMIKQILELGSFQKVVENILHTHFKKEEIEEEEEIEEKYEKED